MGKCRGTTGARQSFHPRTRDNIANKISPTLPALPQIS